MLTEVICDFRREYQKNIRMVFAPRRNGTKARKTFLFET
jgi:hypothetical protein